MNIQKMEWNWEILDCAEDSSLQTARAKVLGGWIVLHLTQDRKKGMISESMVFVPDREHTWTIVKPQPDPVVERANIAKDFIPEGGV